MPLDSTLAPEWEEPVSHVPHLHVRGHALRDEGFPHDADGQRIWGQHGVGHALCKCGALSPRLPSDLARKKWHRQHKRDQLAAQRLDAALHATPDMAVALKVVERIAGFQRQLDAFAAEMAKHDIHIGLSIGAPLATAPPAPRCVTCGRAWPCGASGA